VGDRCGDGRMRWKEDEDKHGFHEPGTGKTDYNFAMVKPRLRVSYAAQLSVESSMITWIATLICAASSTHSPSHIYVCEISFYPLLTIIETQGRFSV
jgi:hypothetical protein